MPSEAEAVQRELLTVEARAPRARRVKVADIVLEADARRDPALVSSIRRVGLLEPPVLVQVGERYKVIAGRRRVAALRQIAREDGAEATMAVEAKVFDEGTLSHGEMASLLLTENGNRSENPAVEMRAVQALLREGYTVAEIAASLSQSQGWVRRRQALATLHPVLLRELKARRLTFMNAVRMAGLPGVEQARVVDDLATRRAADPRARASEDAIRAARAVGEDRTAALFTRDVRAAEEALARDENRLDMRDIAAPAALPLSARIEAAFVEVRGLLALATSDAEAVTTNRARWNTLQRHLQVASERLQEARTTAGWLEEFARRDAQEGVAHATQE